MPDWDEDSERLVENLVGGLREIRQQARSRELPGLEMIRCWHAASLVGLQVPEREMIGRFRGENGLEDVEVTIGSHAGVHPAEVARELLSFQQRLQNVMRRLDERIPLGQEPAVDPLAAILDACAWAHSEWVRIHPFVNGNGRTARLLANGIAMRYGLPPFIRLRPRPGSGYAAAGQAAMGGDWHPTAAVFRSMLADFPRGG